jgi:hypothetical protein
MNLTLQRFIAIIRYSFFSKDMYRLVYESWRHKGLVYLWWLSTLIYVPLICFLWVAIYSITIPKDARDDAAHHKLGEYIRYVADKIPDLHISQGTASTKVPTIIPFPGTTQAMVVVDPSQAHPSAKPLPLLFFGKHAMEVYLDDEPLIYPYKKFLPEEPITIDRQFVIDFFTLLRKILLWTIPLIVFPLAVAIAWMVALVRAMVFSWLYWLALPTASRRHTSHQGLMRLAIVAGTPAAIIDMMLSIIGIYPAGSLLLKAVLGVFLPFVYFVFAARACQAKPVHY